MAAKRRTLSLAKRGFDFEIFMWLFTRLSALAMYLCALIGLVGALIMGARTQVNFADLLRWTFMPNSNHVLMNTTLNNIANMDAWATPVLEADGQPVRDLCRRARTARGAERRGRLSQESGGAPVSCGICVLVLTFVGIAIAVYVVWTH